ncbi:MAG TPA: LLM class flavin-dependent oxidoreductase [Candidatus Dormibacteraeota bacterium]
MKVGVLFPAGFESPGELIADARAMEAADVDSIWINEDAGELDPWLMLAAIAAATNDVRLGLLPGPPSELSTMDERRVHTLQRLSRNRVVGSNERWQVVEVPADRAAWATILQQERPGVDGVIVPHDPRLLDMLRNPEQEIDRPDLALAQG